MKTWHNKFHQSKGSLTAFIYLFLVFYIQSPSFVHSDGGNEGGAQGPQATASGSRTGGRAPAGSGDNFLFTGSFLYNYPIDVPPGIGGMEPQLSLQYNSSSGNSWVGQGWDLSMGFISRSTKNGKPTYDDLTDTFVYSSQGQSQELTKIPDGTYRAKLEGAFQKFVKQGDAWTVFDKSGNQYFFGQAPTTKITTPQGTYQWAINQVVDRNGNTMEFHYTENLKNLYPSEIIYTSNLTTQRAYDRKVVFVLENRPDEISQFRSGVEQRTTQRLQKIETYVRANGTWELVKRYQLNYAIPSSRIKSELVSLQLTGIRGTEQISLPPTTIQYTPSQTHWDIQPATSPFQLPDFMIVSNSTTAVPITRDNGMRFVDLNGDGRSDIVQSVYYAGGNYFRRAWINTPQGWQAEHATWAPPEAITIVDREMQQFRDNGVRFVDLNSDGRTDIIQAAQLGPQTYVKAYLNTGNGWSADQPQWHTPIVNGTRVCMLITGPTWSRDSGVQFVDINGDGRVDIVQSIFLENSQTAERHVWLNTGSGWSSDNPQWNLPQYLSVMRSNGLSSRPNGSIFIDLNGDGLVDFAQNVFFAAPQIGQSQAWLNTGSGWTPAPSQYQLPKWVTVLGTGFEVRDNGLEFVDINSDGLTDIVQSLKHGCPTCGEEKNVYLNTGNGWVNDNAHWTIPVYFSVINNVTDQFQYYSTGHTFIDVNGDAQADLIQGWFLLNSGTSQMSVRWGRSTPELVSQIQNPLGGRTILTYDTTTRETPTSHKIPFPVTVVKKIYNDDGRSTPIDVEYRYDGGLYEPIKREFLGFTRVDSIDAVGHTSKSYFLQNKDPQNQPAPENAYKGRVYKTEQYHLNQQVLRSNETLWEMIVPSSGVYFVRPKFVTSTLHDGPAPLTTKMDYFYDDAPQGPGFGNPTIVVDEGDIAISGDEKGTITEYAINTGAYLLNFPKHIVQLGPNRELLSETKMYYDNATTMGPITRGNVTKMETRLDQPSPRWIATSSQYNAYGQVTQITDPALQRTNTVYDSLGFPISVTNPLGQTIRSTYDLRDGQVLSNTNINNLTAQIRTDALGREIKTIGPLDSEAFPTTETNYHDALLGQPQNQYVEMSVREEHGQAGVITSKDYFDGLGRTYKSEVEDVNNSWRVTETQFNNRDLSDRVSVPRLNNSSEPLQWTQTTYDALGRVKEIIHPDQSMTIHTYNGRMSSVQDANGKIQTSVQDAHGHVIQRFEPGIPTPTEYTYSPAGQLIRLKDSQGQISTFDYDSLGRKLTMTDPNSGTWNYAYDDRGLLTEQTDARGVTLKFTYDVLGRIKMKVLAATGKWVGAHKAGDTLAQYTYDEVDPTHRPFSKGQLTTIVDPTSSTLFSHDELGRTTRVVRTSGSLLYDTKTEYDALGRIKRIVYPSDRKVRYAYNAAGRLERVTNDNGTITYASYPSYNGLGQPLEMWQANSSIKTSYTYDPVKHVLGSLKTERVSPSTIYQEMNYQFDAVGNLRAITDVAFPSRNQQFDYDDLYRLTRAQGAYGSHVQTYDRLGNFMKKATNIFEYNDKNHPYAVTRVIPSTAPSTDTSTLLAWNLDPSEPIYSLSGSVTHSNQWMANIPVTVEGLFGGDILFRQHVRSDSNGNFQFLGIPADSPRPPSSPGMYILKISSVGWLSQPASYVFSPLTQNRLSLNYSLLVDTSPFLNPATLRSTRQMVGFGAPHGGLTGPLGITAGVIGGLNFGGQGQLGANNWSGRSGYAPLGDAPDTIFQGAQTVNNTALLAGSASTGPRFVQGKYQQALSFNGTSDIFVFPTTQQLSPTDLTVMLWVKPSSSPIHGFATLLAKSTNSAGGQLFNGFRLLLNAQGRLVFEVGSTNGGQSLTSSVSLTRDEWTWISATLGSGQMKMYLNGVHVGSQSFAATPITNTMPVTIGASLNDVRGVAAQTLFSGVVDEPRIQGRAWSAAEIAQAYLAYDDFASYTYDENGNAISKTVGPVTTTYRYDEEGRLVAVLENGAPRAEFLTNAMGERVLKTVHTPGQPSQSTVYIGKLFEVRPPTAGTSGPTLVDHVFSGGALVADVVASSTGSVQTNYYQTDHLGSTSLVMDSNGSLLQSLTYAPFGKIQSVNGQSALKHKYTQQEDDESTDLYFYNARYYDPALGRFLSADTIVPSAMDPQSLNRYAYVRNNPEVLTDPDGHFAFLVPVLAGAAIGALSAGAQSNWNSSQMWKGAMIGAISGFAGAGANALVGGGINGALAGGFAGGGTSGGLSEGLNGGNILHGMAQGAIIGGVGGAIYGSIGQSFGDKWSTPRVFLQAGVSGGLNKIQGGKFSQGFIIAGGAAIAKMGWQAARNWTLQSQLKGTLPTIENKWGEPVVAGTRDESGVDKTRNALALDFMDPHDSNPNRLGPFKYDINSQVGRLVNQIGAVHDLLNGWNYGSDGNVMPGNAGFETFFGITSFLAMPPAAGFTIFSLSAEAYQPYFQLKD